MYFQPKGIVDSNDVNSALENDLESDDEKDDIRMKRREQVSSARLPNRLAEAQTLFT